MKKSKMISVVIVVVLSIGIVYGISTYLFNLTGKVNQGKYRINDAVVKSSVIIDEKQSTVDELSNMELDVSQDNVISLLIPNEYEINRATIDNIKITTPIKVGNMYIGQSKKDKIYDISRETQVNIYPEEKDDEYLIEIEIGNEKCLKDVNVPSQTNVVRFDGTILELLNQNISDYKFDVSFNLNLYDEVGNKFVCKIKKQLPDDSLITDGLVVRREDLSSYIFRAK